MISKTRLKELASYRLPKNCETDNLFVIEGTKMAAEALQAAVPLRQVCATSQWLDAHAHSLTCEYHEVNQQQLERLSTMRCPNQVWMLAERFVPQVDEGTTILALDGLQDPGNMGTILRTADWFGVRHVVCSSNTVSHFNPKVVQASMGAIFRTKVDYVDLGEWLAHQGLPVVGATLHGTPISPLYAWPKPAVLLIGNEGHGISPSAMQHVSHPILIPNVGGTAESLNAAVATSILLSWMSVS